MAAPAHIARENGKKGGRPKGSKSPATLEREAVQAALRQRTLRNADVLYDAQITLAKGQTFLYKIEKYYEGSGKNRVLKRKKPQLVTSQYEIEDYLENRLDEGDLEDKEATYYFLTTKEPNNQAIDSMLDRALGKAIQVTDNTHHFDRFGTDDLNALLSVLSKDEQTKFYETLSRAAAIVQGTGGGAKIQENSA
jgi:hypothetical protein